MSFNVNTFNSDNWHRDAPSIARRNQIKTRRWGMRVTVYLTASAGDYVLSYGLASTDLQDNNNWLKVANIGATWGGGGGAVTADNGLTATGSNVQLGGLLIQNTIIDGDAAYSFRVTNADNISLDCANYLELIGGTSGVNLSGIGQTLINSLDGVGISAPSVAAVGQSLGMNFTAVSGDLWFEATNDAINFIAGEFQLQSLTAISGTTQFFAGDGSWRYALGQALDGNVTSPTAGEDGYVLSWNDGNQEYELVPPSGGGLTFENGVEEISAGVVGLGSPLTQNTLINGATFNLQLGTFVTSPIGTFQSYAGSHFWSSRDPGTGAAAGLTLNTEFQVGLASDGGKMIVQQTTAQTDENAPIVTFDRLGDNTNAPGLLCFDSARSSGTAAAGFGIFNQLSLEVSNGSMWIAMQDEITWEVATVAGEYSQWRKSLTQDHDVVEVYKIETNPDILHTFTGLIMMGDLPAVDPGIPGRLYHTAGAVMVSL